MVERNHAVDLRHRCCGLHSFLTIAHVIKNAMGSGDAAVRVTAEPDERAWPGDVKAMQLDVTKIKRHGWRSKRSSDEAIRAAANELIHELAR